MEGQPALWGTKREIDFVKSLGNNGRKHGKTKLQLLRRYLKGAKLREDWANIDKKKVLQFANSELKVLEGKP